jgi:hypothetical protein
MCRHRERLPDTMVAVSKLNFQQADTLGMSYCHYAADGHTKQKTAHWLMGVRLAAELGWELELGPAIAK